MKKSILFLTTVILAVSITAQNVGIGTIVPAEKLHVNGNVKADTVKPAAIKLIPNAGNGRILTSDAAGNASWQLTNSAPGNIGYGVWGDCSVSGVVSEYQPMADSADANDYHGRSVAMSGSFAIVGTSGDDVNGISSQGSAAIYEFDGTKWVYKQKLLDPAGAIGDQLGYSVAISGNFAIVGAPYDDVGADNAQGSACVFRYNGTSWVFQQKITDATGAADDHFGITVSISGTHLIIGTPDDDAGVNADEGSASVYNYNGTSWVLKSKLLSPTGEAGDSFGQGVAVSGSLLAIGAPYDDDGGTNSGSVSYYRYNGSSWIFIRTQIIFVAGALMGYSLAMSGDLIMIGAPGYDPGSSANKGTAYIYIYDGSDWSLLDNVSDSEGLTGDYFGISVAISDDLAMAGSYWDDVGSNNNQGSAVLFRRIGNVWRRIIKISDPSGESSDTFGYSTAIDAGSKRFLVGAPQSSGNGQRGLVFFGKIN
ncbi:MAG TPA: hypothetical protein VGO58_20480 [Chitinophagaceae bacterium]|jgi:hypothetical protein|nr:hypothetical protein [Chitinophagaceae bacterium]